MNNGEYIFSQLVSFLPQKYFYRLSSKYNGDKYSKHFSSWNQLLCMIFGQLSNRNSLRDLVLFLNAHSEKSYHLGLGKSIQLSNFSHANEKRPCKIFEEYMNKMISIAKEKVVAKDFRLFKILKLNKILYYIMLSISSLIFIVQFIVLFIMVGIAIFTN